MDNSSDISNSDNEAAGKVSPAGYDGNGDMNNLSSPQKKESTLKQPVLKSKSKIAAAFNWSSDVESTISSNGDNQGHGGKEDLVDKMDSLKISSTDKPSSADKKTAADKTNKYSTKIYRRRKLDPEVNPLKLRRGKTKKINDYGKVFTVFKCESETCGKSWSSAHGWTAATPVYCEHCESTKPAKIKNMVPDMMFIEEFVCNGAYCGGNKWISISLYTEDEPCPPASEECDLCRKLVLSGGAQWRYARHYSYRCRNKECGVEWEDADLGKENYSQRCKACHGRGNKTGVRKETAQDRQRRGGFGGGGGHNVDGCDMCQKLKRDGFAPTCIRQKRVVMEAKTDEDGITSESIIGTYTEGKHD